MTMTADFINMINTLSRKELAALSTEYTDKCLKLYDEGKEEESAMYDKMADAVEEQMAYLEHEEEEAWQYEDMMLNRG